MSHSCKDGRRNNEKKNRFNTRFFVIVTTTRRIFFKKNILVLMLRTIIIILVVVLFSLSESSLELIPSFLDNDNASPLQVTMDSYFSFFLSLSFAWRERSNMVCLVSIITCLRSASLLAIHACMQHACRSCVPFLRSSLGITGSSY